jgi:acetyl esterase
MPIDPELDTYYARVAEAFPMPSSPDVAERRARMRAISMRFAAPPDSVRREDHLIALPGRQLRVRIYRPEEGTLPAVVYLHGGGWVAGDIETHDGVCATLAQDAGVVVASVDYRRPPEHPFPDPNDDAYTAACWVAERADALGIDAAHLGVAGDSAGAHLAAGAALEARDRGGPRLLLQLLIYPVIEPDFETPSNRVHAVTPSLSRADMIAFWRDYLPNASADARAVPIRAPTLTGLPPAHIVVASLDPLRDEGVRYAAALEGAGVLVRLVEESALTHGFLRAGPFVRSAREAQRALGIAAGRALRQDA